MQFRHRIADTAEVRDKTFWKEFESSVSHVVQTRVLSRSSELTGLPIGLIRFQNIICNVAFNDGDIQVSRTLNCLLLKQ